jgi:hypothetical protein
MANEVGRRKTYTADIEVEVTRLMSSAKQSAKLSDYINEHLNWFNEEGIQDGWPAELDEIRLDEDKDEEYNVNNLAYHNFL